jgi:hypothetical protein
MRGFRLYKKVIISIAGLSALALLLSGCLVEDKDPPPLTDRSTDSLRLIQAGDRIVYYIEGTRTVGFTAPSSFTGRMTVEWFNDAIEDPNTPGTQQIPVLREVTTIEYDSGGGVTTVRYITQDPDGNVYLHGYYNKPGMLYVGEIGPTPYSYGPIQVVPSPLTMTNYGSDYRVLQCSDATNTCTNIRRLSEAVEYQSELDLVTRNGRRYNTLYYTYTGFLPDGVLLPLPSPTPLDFRMACDENADVFNGEYYFFPEVGLVAFLSSCASTDTTGTRISYRTYGSLQSASFALP